MTVQSIAVKALRPTQIAVGMKLVKAKRRGLRSLEGKPQELVNFILANPLRVVAGPSKLFFIIDHHHLAHALLDEGFKTAPMEMMGDLSTLSMAEFWKQMDAKGWVYPHDGKGRKRAVGSIPRKVKDLEDDPYRSLAGLVREGGGFLKSQTPYAEFLWADFYRTRIPMKVVKKDFTKALARAKRMASSADAAMLPGYTVQGVAKVSKKNAVE